jgi:hypothetical protein
MAPGSGAGLRLLERGSVGSYVLQLWPSRLYAVPVALFTFLWLRFLWRWYALLLLGANLGPPHQSRGFFVLFGLPFLLAGLSLIGTSARLCFGRTVLSLDATRLIVRDGLSLRDLPWGHPLVLPTLSIREFVAEASARPGADGDEDHELDAWHVSAHLDDGRHATLSLPVRTLAEADDVVGRLNRALKHVRTPRGYRDEAPTSSSDGSDSPLGPSIT